MTVWIPAGSGTRDGARQGRSEGSPAAGLPGRERDAGGTVCGLHDGSVIPDRTGPANMAAADHGAECAPLLLPLWEKVDRRVSAGTDEGCWPDRQRLISSNTPHPPLRGTFSHKGRRGSHILKAWRFRVYRSPWPSPPRHPGGRRPSGTHWPDDRQARPGPRRPLKNLSTPSAAVLSFCCPFHGNADHDGGCVGRGRRFRPVLVRQARRGRVQRFPSGQYGPGVLERAHRTRSPMIAGQRNGRGQKSPDGRPKGRAY